MLRSSMRKDYFTATMSYFTSFSCHTYLLLLFLTTFAYIMYKKTYFKRKNVIAVDSNLVFGNLPQFARKNWTFIDSSYIEKYGDVFGFYLGNTPFLIIADTDMLQEIFVNKFSKFTERPQIVDFTSFWKNDITLANGVTWKPLRNTLHPAFSVKMNTNKDVSRSIEDEMVTLIKRLNTTCETNTDGFDIFPFIDTFSMDSVVSAYLGIKSNTQSGHNGGYIRHATEFIEYPGARWILLNFVFPELYNMFGSWTLSDINATKEALEYYTRAIRSAVCDRIESGMRRDDLLQTMLDNCCYGDVDDEKKKTRRQRKKQNLTDDSVLVNMTMLVTGGYSIIQSVLSWLIYDLATHIDIQETLINEITTHIGDDNCGYENINKLQYLDMVVSETLRLHPPVTRATRSPNENITLNGIKIERGLHLVIPIYTIHMSSKYWKHPHTYSPERFSPDNKHSIKANSYLPFGRGPRGCIAKQFGLMVVKLTIVNILRNFRLEPTDKLKIPMPMSIGAVAKPVDKIHVKLIPL